MGGGAAGWAIAAQGITDIGKTVAAGVASKIAWKRTKRILKNRHQWEVADLIAAGLNPILSATKGPGGGASVAAQQIPGGAGVGELVLKGSKVKTELAILKNQQRYWGSAADREFHTANKTLYEARTALAESIIRGAQVPSALKTGEFDKTKAGGFLRVLKRVRESVPLPFIGGASAAPRR